MTGSRYACIFPGSAPVMTDHCAGIVCAWMGTGDRPADEVRRKSASAVYRLKVVRDQAPTNTCCIALLVTHPQVASDQPRLPS